MNTAAIFLYRGIGLDEADNFEGEDKEDLAGMTEDQPKSSRNFLDASKSKRSAMRQGTGKFSRSFRIPKFTGDYAILNDKFRLRKDRTLEEKLLGDDSDRIVMMCLQKETFLEFCNLWPKTAIKLQDLALQRRNGLLKHRDKKWHITKVAQKRAPVIGISQRLAKKHNYQKDDLNITA